MIGLLLVGLLTVGMAGIGVFACLFPRLASYLYGVPQEDADGRIWVRAAGVRDLGLVLLLVGFYARGWLEPMAWVAIATGLVAVADLASVLVRRGLLPLPALVHASGVATGIVGGVLLAIPAAG